MILSNSQYYSPLSKIACVGNLVRNQMVASMACKPHLSFRAAQKFLFKYVYNTMGLIQVGGNGACSSKKKDQHMPLRVPPSAGRAAAGCTNCSTIVVKLCSEVLIYLPQKFWLDENINLPRRSGLYPDYQPFRRQFSKVFVSLIRIRVDVVPPRP